MAKPSNEFLDEERKKTWNRLINVENSIDKITEEVAKGAGDYSSEAKQASKMASEYKNRSEISKNSILQYATEAKNKLDDIAELERSIRLINNQVTNNANEAKDNGENIKSIVSEVEIRKSDIEETIEKLELIFEEFDTHSDNLSRLKDLLTESDETATKIDVLHKSLLSRKKEIDQVYYEIFGYTDRQNGIETEIEGLKNKLEKSYDELSEQLTESIDQIEQIRSKTEKEYDEVLKKSKTDYEKHILDWNINYRALEGKIEALLPKALTAGLSYAYSEKKEVELKEYKRLNIYFIISIIGLMIVSLVPFTISYYSFVHNKPIEKVLLDMPRLVLSILPLYIPVLWVAYSSNRKMNLSKRLSEEYSHKEVLSKTFEGLSTQINNMSDTAVSDDLRNKLLYNILEVSAENPGKLISDYNKADHPLMDALDKSVKLATAFEKLEKIPGFSALAKKMGKKSTEILNQEGKKVKIGLDSIEEEQEES